MRRDASAPAPAPTSQSASQIAAGSKIVGELTGKAELRIDGEVDGLIKVDSNVVIGPSGVVKGEIQARAVQVQGKVKGNVRGLEKVEILAKGSLEGDVVSPRMIIVDGAFFKGKVEMGGSASPGDAKVG